MSNYEEIAKPAGKTQAAEVAPVRDRRQDPVPAVKILMGLNIGVYAVGLALGLSPVIQAHAALFPSEVLQGRQLWSVFTYMFLHGGTTHLVMNMLGLMLIGREIEFVLKRRRFFVMYFISGLAGGFGYIVMAALLGNTAPCVGASGAISGVLGALVALYPNQRLYIIFLPWFPMRAWVLGLVLVTVHLFFMFTPYGGRVAYDVHLFGGFAGYLYCLILARKMRRRRSLGGMPAPRPAPAPSP